jgi:hypothetical protein
MADNGGSSLVTNAAVAQHQMPLAIWPLAYNIDHGRFLRAKRSTISRVV